MSPVQWQWVPPQSSREGPASTTRTGVHVGVLQDRGIHFILDALELLLRQRPIEGEVEAQIRRVHQRARLVDILAEHPAQDRMQQVCRGVVAHRVAAQIGIHRRARGRADPEQAVHHLRAHHDDPGRGGLRVRHHCATRIRRDGAAVANLAPSLRVEGSAVEHDLDVGPFAGLIHALAADHERKDAGVADQLVIAGELAAQALLLPQRRIELPEAHDVLSEFRARARAAPLRVEKAPEAGLVDRQARAACDLTRHLEREAEGVVEPEGRIAVDP